MSGLIELFPNNEIIVNFKIFEIILNFSIKMCLNNGSITEKKFKLEYDSYNQKFWLSP